MDSSNRKSATAAIKIELEEAIKSNDSRTITNALLTNLLILTEEVESKDKALKGALERVNGLEVAIKNYLFALEEQTQLIKGLKTKALIKRESDDEGEDHPPTRGISINKVLPLAKWSKQSELVFDTWLEQFQSCVSIYKWNDEATLAHLFFYLDPSCFLGWYTLLSDSDKKDFNISSVI